MSFSAPEDSQVSESHDSVVEASSDWKGGVNTLVATECWCKDDLPTARGAEVDFSDRRLEEVASVEGHM